MVTARLRLTSQADRFRFSSSLVFDGDYDLRPCKNASASDMIQLVCALQDEGFNLYFSKDNSIHVHAPHRKEHSWGDRGWECDAGLSIEGCEAIHAYGNSKSI